MHSGYKVKIYKKPLGDSDFSVDGVNFGYSPKLAILARKKNLIAARISGRKDWGDMLHPSIYVNPRLMVFKVKKEGEDNFFTYYEVEDVLYDEDYTRETRKEAYAKAAELFGEEIPMVVRRKE